MIKFSGCNREVNNEVKVGGELYSTKSMMIILAARARAIGHDKLVIQGFSSESCKNLTWKSLSSFDEN